MKHAHLYDEEPEVRHLDELELLLTDADQGVITIFRTKATDRINAETYTGAIARCTMEDVNRALEEYAARQGGPVAMTGLGWMFDAQDPDVAPSYVALVLIIIDANFSANGLVSVRKIAGWEPQSMGSLWFPPETPFQKIELVDPSAPPDFTKLGVEEIEAHYPGVEFPPGFASDFTTLQHKEDNEE